MKIQFLILGFCSLLSGSNIFAQHASDAASILMGLFEPDSQTNIIMTVFNNCPTQYTNSLSNTNLFTLSERKLIEDVLTKYKFVTTNSGPPGTVLVGFEETSNYCVAHFSYTNTGSHESVTFRRSPEGPPHGGGYDELVSPTTSGSYMVARFRNDKGGGYDAIITPVERKVLTYAQIEKNTVNGLVIEFQNDYCEDLLHFVDGKAVGKWLVWGGPNDNYLLEVKIKSSLDYFKYTTQEITN